MYELAALLASLVWSFTGLLSVGPARLLGGFGFNRIRNIFVAILICVLVLATGGWQSLSKAHVYPLVLSGIVGILLGDSLLFAALKRVGPRINAIVFAMNAPIAAVLGFLFLDERLSLGVYLGCVLMTAGVVLAVAYGRRLTLGNEQGAKEHEFERTEGIIWVGVVLGLLAATCQALGALIAKPVMLQGVDAIEAASVRVSAGAVIMLLTFAHHNDLHKLDARHYLQILLSGILGIGIGMTLVTYALIGGDTGVVLTLSSLSPVIILPILWCLTGLPPRPLAWLGAVIAAIGSTMIFML